MTYTDPRLPRREDVVQRYLVDRFAEERPSDVFIRFRDGEEWTFSELRDRARRAAGGFRRLGVGQGDHVASFLPSSRDAICVWFGLNYIGAVYVPLNPAHKGNVLSHTIKTSDAKLLVAHTALVPNLTAIDLGSVTDLVSIGGDDATVDGLAHHSGDILTAEPGDLELERPIEVWDTQGIWYTSGTTGPSKGVLSSYMHAYNMFGPETMPFIRSDDRYMINLPLFHMGGTGLFNCMLLRGASVAFIERFRTPDFWPAVRETQSTVVFMLGTMAAFIESQPPSPDDADNPLRVAFVIPVPESVPAFAERFGIEVRSIYNMTEICSPIVTGPTPDLPGTCGRLREGAQVRLVDENDCEVPVGEVGEFIVRDEMPWGMNHGYHGMPEATARAWRNGWFHTGDAGRVDEDGNYYFVDRIKDVIRRRGEFISSLELEIELCAHPDVATAATLGVPSDYAEEEVLAVLVPAEGRQIDFVDVVEFLQDRVAYFMIPRYMRAVDALPMTATEKVRKTVLRDEGLTPDTWDREAAGIKTKAQPIA
jgi:carnitine-CoA ligase